MELDTRHVQKPLRKLRKQLNAFPANPRPEDVHSLRTQTRRLEAAVAAMLLNREKPSRRLLKLITPVRKAAGEVRDMDVLIGHVLTLSDDHGREALVRLVEYLSKMRARNARKLQDVIRRQKQQIDKRLKQSSKLLKKKLEDDSTAVNGKTGPQILITELGHWPPLDQSNLHQFRIRVKELRYMLQLSEQPDKQLVGRLGEVKDTVGEWHDWIALLEIAQKKLDRGPEAELLNEIEEIGQQKFRTALTSANQLRSQYFDRPPNRKPSRKVPSMAKVTKAS